MSWTTNACGGFLHSHGDEVAAGVPASAGLHGYIQVLLVLTEKGTDFHTGGGYSLKNGERVLYEEFTEPGDVLVYNGRTLHGVETVDADEPVDLTSPRGRYSATVTLYRTRWPGAQDRSRRAPCLTSPRIPPGTTRPDRPRGPRRTRRSS